MHVEFMSHLIYNVLWISFATLPAISTWGQGLKFIAEQKKTQTKLMPQRRLTALKMLGNKRGESFDQ